VLDEPKYAEAATRAADAVLSKRRRFLDDGAPRLGPAESHEATFDVRHLETAIALNDEATKLFRDANGRYYITPAMWRRCSSVRAKRATARSLPAIRCSS
jgi:uncharacterized protein YyaL (SSP411 family)